MSPYFILEGVLGWKRDNRLKLGTEVSTKYGLLVNNNVSILVH